MGDTLMTLHGEYEVQCWNEDGSLAWSFVVPNTLTVEGLTHILNVVFKAATQSTNWFMGLITNTGYTAISADDTAASHTGWTEYTAYTNGSRPGWDTLNVSGGVVINTSPIQFSFTSTGTIRGFFIASTSTKLGTSGVLMSASEFLAARTILVGQTLTVKYTLSAAGGT